MDYPNGDIMYIRYNDDILILTKTLNQYKRAKKRLFRILKSLKLSIAKRKTKFGKSSDIFISGPPGGTRPPKSQLRLF